MSKIFELFGYRLSSWNDQAAANRARAWCPFMDAACDGGGNRQQSAVYLREHADLRPYFPNMEKVQAGVCSLQMNEDDQPWIVCPRRLLSLRHGEVSNYQTQVKNQLIQYAGLEPKQKYRVWSEVKMKVETTTAQDEEKFFDYTFDYILAGSRRIRLAEVAAMIDESEHKTQAIAQKNGYAVTTREDIWIEDFPGNPIVIIEIMTSSTSGGNKNNRTQISMAFEDAVKHPQQHNGPGINYRQVWARMVSQLIVKSQVGLAWGGKTFWLVQDVLADYISSSTALDLESYVGDHADEVNILAFGYGDLHTNTQILQLPDITFYAGPIVKGATENQDNSGFVDIVKVGAPPPADHLWRALFLKTPCGSISC